MLECVKFNGHLIPCPRTLPKDREFPLYRLSIVNTNTNTVEITPANCRLAVVISPTMIEKAGIALQMSGLVGEGKN